MAKRKRNQNWNEDELDVLVDSVSENRTIVLDSFSAAVAAKDKNKFWEETTDKVSFVDNFFVLNLCNRVRTINAFVHR